MLSTELEGWQSLAAGRAAQHYRERLAPNAVMAFPFGTMTRQEAIEAMAAAAPWLTFQLDDPQAMEIGADAGVLVYRVQAQRTGDPPYTAIVSSTFVAKTVNGSWPFTSRRPPRTPPDGLPGESAQALARIPR